MATTYTAADIQVLTGIEAVRRRPGMYIGDADRPDAIHHMLWEVVGNAVDEHRRGHASYVRITIDGDRIAIEDDGCGIPTDPYPHRSQAGRSILEVVLTTLHAGTANYRHEHVHITSGLMGVGVAATCALSAELEAEVWYAGAHHTLRFVRGQPVGPLRTLGPTTRTGTRIAFTPDFTLLRRHPWNADAIHARARELAACQPALAMIVDHAAYRCPAGLVDLVRYLAGDATLVGPYALHGQRDGVTVDVALGLRAHGKPAVHGFVNCARGDGTHVTGLLAGLHTALARRIPRLRRLAPATLRDRLAGLVIAVHATLADPRWGNPTRDWLANEEVGEVVAAVVTAQFDTLVAEHPALLDAIVARA